MHISECDNFDSYLAYTLGIYGSTEGIKRGRGNSSILRFYATIIKSSHKQGIHPVRCSTIFCGMRPGGASRYRRKERLRLMDRRSFRISGICTSERTDANERVRNNSLALIRTNGSKFKQRDQTSVFARWMGLPHGRDSGKKRAGSRRCMQILLSIR